jgi:hypothetical protein
MNNIKIQESEASMRKVKEITRRTSCLDARSCLIPTTFSILLQFSNKFKGLKLDGSAMILDHLYAIAASLELKSSSL